MPVMRHEGPRGRLSPRSGIARILNPPDGLVAWLRWLSLFYGLTVLSVVLAVLCAAQAGASAALIAVATVMALAGYQIWGYSGRRYTIIADVAAAIALLFIGMQFASPVPALAVFSAIVGARALYGHRRPIAPVAALHASMYVGAMLASAPERS